MRPLCIQLEQLEYDSFQKLLSRLTFGSMDLESYIQDYWE